MSTITASPEIVGLKARLKETWMAGDYDRFSRYILNLRGQRSPPVPANGYLATLLSRWSLNKVDGSSQLPFPCLGNPSRIAQGNLCFPLTLTYHGRPRSA